MPFRDWETGDQPTGAEFDEFIGAQVVGIYADAATRDTDITILTDGMRAVTLDNRVEWVAVQTSTDPDPVVVEWVEFGRWGTWATYTPTLTATGTNPTLGTGPTQLGRWTKEGTLATVAIYIALGSSGSAAGTGIYEISLPTECPAEPTWYGAQEFIAGNGISIDDSTGTRYAVAVSVVGANTIRIESDGLTGPVTDSNLIAWGDSDIVLSAVITYETPEV